jgi:hypothetical protein
VLAGISGTGKSELPRQYATAMGLPFFQLAVQPRWDSPQDLFGFYNYLEHRYKPTELARLMLHLDARNWPEQARPYKEHMALVLLDEMNLARVEYYFSEFLSRLEVRRDGKYVPAAEIELELGRLPEGWSRKIYPDPRMLFVGTMNEDESTQTLSDKVVDRANVMRFPKPKTLAASTVRPPPRLPPLPIYRIRFGGPGAAGMSFPRWRDGSQRSTCSWRSWGGPSATAWLKPSMPMWRTIQRAARLEMRIFPKLRGVAIDDRENRAALDAVGAFIKSELRYTRLAEEFEAACTDRDLFLWRGVDRS